MCAKCRINKAALSWDVFLTIWKLLEILYKHTDVSWQVRVLQSPFSGTLTLEQNWLPITGPYQGSKKLRSYDWWPKNLLWSRCLGWPYLKLRWLPVAACIKVSRSATTYLNALIRAYVTSSSVKSDISIHSMYPAYLNPCKHLQSRVTYLTSKVERCTTQCELPSWSAKCSCSLEAADEKLNFSVKLANGCNVSLLVGMFFFMPANLGRSLQHTKVR